MNWQDHKVLITGADGFIGSQLAEALVDAGADVTALSLYNSFGGRGWLDNTSPERRDRMRHVSGDIRDPHQMMALVVGQDVVFHLAALIAIPYSYDAPGSYVDTNVHGTLNLLTAAREAGVSRFIHTSTSEVYGSAQFTPITEAHPLQGQSPYSASKIGADVMATAFYNSFELPVVTLRPFNTYGPRQSERAVIPTIIRQALDPNCETIRLGDLTPTRDFNYVGDTVTGFLAAAAVKDAELGQTFNCGSGRMVSIGEVAQTILKHTDCGKPIETDEIRMRPPGSEVMALMADASAFTTATGWTPETKLETGLGLTIDWWRSHMANVRPDTGYAI